MSSSDDILDMEICSYEEAIRKYAKGKFVKVHGKMVHYIEHGEGEPLLLIHGFLYHTITWQHSIDALARKFKVFAIDLWGWGYSERGDAEDVFGFYEKQIVGFLDAMHLEKVSLIGHSMGGGYCIQTAAHHPDRINKLIVISPHALAYPVKAENRTFELPSASNLAIGSSAKDMLKIIAQFLYPNSDRVSADYLQELLRPICIEGTETGFRRAFRSAVDPQFIEKEAGMFATRGIPLLICHGSADKVVPVDASKRLQDLCPDSRLEIIEDAGHHAHEDSPAKFNHHAIEFLS